MRTPNWHIDGEVDGGKVKGNHAFFGVELIGI
jgi:hypothetical protein